MGLVLNERGESVKTDQNQIENIVSQVLKQLQAQESGNPIAKPRGQELQIKDSGTASAGSDSKEVVIGIGPAFGKTLHKTIIGLDHESVLSEVLAGIEEEGMHARVVRIMRTSDVGFIAHDAAKISGSGIGIGIQSKGTTVIHQKDLLPLSNLELFPLAPLLGIEEYRSIGRNAAKYAKGESPRPVSIELDIQVLPIYQPAAVLMHNKETQLVVERADPVSIEL